MYSPQLDISINCFSTMTHSLISILILQFTTCILFVTLSWYIIALSDCHFHIFMLKASKRRKNWILNKRLIYNWALNLCSLSQILNISLWITKWKIWIVLIAMMTRKILKKKKHPGKMKIFLKWWISQLLFKKWKLSH